MNKIKKLIFLLPLVFLIACSNQENQQADNKPYKGKTITVIIPKLSADLVRGPILKNKKEFEKKTGAKIRVVTPNWSETIKSIEQSLEKDSKFFYDIYVVIGLWNGTLLSSGKDIAEVPQWVKDKLEWEDVLPIYKNNILKWNNITYGIPYDGDNISLYYRKDIFENKSYQEKFLKQYGYELDVPKTWTQYKDIAKFFSGWDWDNDGEIEFGVSGSRLKGDVSLLKFFAFAGAYNKSPNQDCFYFDTNTMDAKINSKGFIRALDEYIELTNYGPKGMKNFAGHDMRDAFVKGEVAMAIDWTNLGILASNSPYSIVADKTGYATLPGSNQVYNAKEKTWNNVYNAPSSISGNWTLMVSNHSKNKKLAFEFASFIASKEKTKEYITDPSSGINPSRYSHLDDLEPWMQAGFSKENAQGYVNTIKESLSNKNVLVDILIPGGAKYYEILDYYVYEALIGNMSSEEALDIAAKEWNELTDTLGREKQKQYYKESLNITKIEKL